MVVTALLSTVKSLCEKSLFPSVRNSSNIILANFMPSFSLSILTCNVKTCEVGEYKTLIFGFNFKGSSHKISHPAQLCYRQNKEKSNITIKVSDHPSLSIGSYVIMSIYQATNSKKYVNVTTSGIEVHFSFINWMLHLPLKMLIFVSALIGIIITLLGLLILLVIYLKLDKNHSKHRRRPKVKIRDPAPQVPKHESSDSINIDINPEDNSQ